MLSAKCSLLRLTALPIQEQRFYLQKQEFQDALWLRYGWKLSRVSSHCICGALYSADHNMICHHGGLPFIHHNELGNLTTSWLHEVYHDMACEPPLQPLTSKALVPASANRRDDARTDIQARGFWGRWQDAFLQMFSKLLFHWMLRNILVWTKALLGCCKTVLRPWSSQFMITICSLNYYSTFQSAQNCACFQSWLSKLS